MSVCPDHRGVVANSTHGVRMSVCLSDKDGTTPEGRQHSGVFIMFILKLFIRLPGNMSGVQIYCVDIHVNDIMSSIENPFA